MNDESEFDLLTLKFEKNATVTKIGMSRSVYEIFMRGLNCQLQFERGHVKLVLVSDLGLQFKVKYWPKLGTYLKFNIIGRLFVGWQPSTTEV